MDSLFRLVNLVMVAFTVAMTIAMLLNFRKERPIGKYTPLWSAGLSLVALPAFATLSGARLYLPVALLVFGLGLLVGFMRGRTIRLYFKDGRVVCRKSLLFLVGWGISLALAQLLTMADSALLVTLGLPPLVLTTGTQVGMEGNVFLRRLAIKPPDGASDSGSGAQVLAHVGLPERPRRR